MPMKPPKAARKGNNTNEWLMVRFSYCSARPIVKVIGLKLVGWFDSEKSCFSEVYVSVIFPNSYVSGLVRKPL